MRFLSFSTFCMELTSWNSTWKPFTGNIALLCLRNYMYLVIACWWVRRAVRGPVDDNAGAQWSAIQILTSRHHHRHHLETVRRWRRPSDVTLGRAVRRTRYDGETGAAVRLTTTPCVVPAVVSVTLNVSATTTDSSSAEVSAPTTSVFFADYSVIRNTNTLLKVRSMMRHLCVTTPTPNTLVYWPVCLYSQLFCDEITV